MIRAALMGRGLGLVREALGLEPRRVEFGRSGHAPVGVEARLRGPMVDVAVLFAPPIRCPWEGSLVVVDEGDGVLRTWPDGVRVPRGTSR